MKGEAVGSRQQQRPEISRFGPPASYLALVGLLAGVDQVVLL